MMKMRIPKRIRAAIDANCRAGYTSTGEVAVTFRCNPDIMVARKIGTGDYCIWSHRLDKRVASFPTAAELWEQMEILCRD